MVLPIISAPLNSKALLKEFLEENLTKAKPLGPPSGFVNSLTFVIFPHSSKKLLISPS